MGQSSFCSLGTILQASVPKVGLLLQNTLLQSRDSYPEGLIGPLCTWICTARLSLSLNPESLKHRWSPCSMAAGLWWRSAPSPLNQDTPGQCSQGGTQQIEPDFWSHQWDDQG